MGQHTSPNSKTSGTRNNTQHANSACGTWKMYSTPGLETLFVWWCPCWPSVNSLPLSGIPPLASHASSHRVSELLPHTHHKIYKHKQTDPQMLVNQFAHGRSCPQNDWKLAKIGPQVIGVGEILLPSNEKNFCQSRSKSQSHWTFAHFNICLS